VKAIAVLIKHRIDDVITLFSVLRKWCIPDNVVVFSTVGCVQAANRFTNRQSGPKVIFAIVSNDFPHGSSLHLLVKKHHLG